jgi:hypothetical protein
MNKNSLKQMIVAEMILADIGEGRSESPKKRSLFEMMEDSYLAELDDNTLVHSMKAVHDIYEEVDTSNHSVVDPTRGIRRLDQRSDKSRPKTKMQQDAIDASKAAWAEIRAKNAAAAASEVNPADTPEAQPEPEAQLPATTSQPEKAEIEDNSAADAAAAAAAKKQNTDNATDVEYEFEEDPKTLTVSSDIKDGGGDSQGPGDKEPDPDVNNPSGGLAYLDSLAQKEIDLQTNANTKPTSESRLSLINLLYNS